MSQERKMGDSESRALQKEGGKGDPFVHKRLTNFIIGKEEREGVS